MAGLSSRPARFAGLALGLAVAGTVAASALSAPGGGTPATAPAEQGTSGLLSDPVARAQSTLRTQPANWLAWTELGAAYVQRGRVTADPTYYPKAQLALERSLRLRPDNDRAMTALAALQAARHDFTAALAWSRRATSRNPASANGFAVMSDALVELGRYADAARALQRAVDLKPGVATFARVSYLRELHGDVPGALAAMRQAWADAFSPADGAFSAYYLGLLAFNSGDLAGAGRAFAAGLRLDPSYPPLYAGRAKVAAAQGRVSSAIADFTTAVTRYPAVEFLVDFGDYLSSLGRRAEAAQQYAVVAVQDRLLRANGVNPDLELAGFLADHGAVARAVTAARAEWQRRRSILVADALAWALHRAGRDREALGYARYATSLGYRNALLYFHLGLIEQSLGDPAAAGHLRLALRINPHFSPLRAAQARAALAVLAGRR